MKRNTPKAFTLVELLVVIAIIGIMVSLLLPAIQAARESARRAQCTNQLRQLILAVNSFDMAHEHYPPGTVNPQGPIQNLPKGHHISWIAHILPFLEEQVLYDNLDLSLSAYHHKNDRARQTTIELLLCPSSYADFFPQSNYAGCHHDVEAPIDAHNRGVFFLNSALTREDLKDGAAYILFIGEKIGDDTDLGWLSGTPGTLRNTGTQLNPSPLSPNIGLAPPWFWPYSAASDENAQWNSVPEEPANDETAADDASTLAVGKKHVPADDAAPSDAAVERVAGEANPPDAVAARIDPEEVPDANGLLPHSRLGGNPAAPLAVGGFASNHAGGVNFAFGDGSVRYMADSASAGLMHRLANRADGEIVDAKEW